VICIREEGPKDIGDVRKLNEITFMQAFGQASEANVIDSLRENCANILSLVAVQDDQIVGHIFFSPVKIDGDKVIEGTGLGPMAVLPKLQRQGIGSQLVQAGIEILKGREYPFIIVLGHPEYCPCFTETSSMKSCRGKQGD
jgi:putative acetyltransferase